MAFKPWTEVALKWLAKTLVQAIPPKRPVRAANLKFQEKAGGPRAGGGALVRAAMWAAGIGCSACPSGCIGKATVCAVGGGALTVAVAHSGQSSMRLTASVLLPSAFLTSTFITPEPEQMSSVD